MTKSIIDGLRYNTEADGTECVASWSNGYGYSDFNHCSEDLYRTANGNWFIVGSGGPRSRYAVSTGNGKSGSKDNVRPLSDDEAYDWAESHGKTAVLEEYFSDRVEDA